MERFINDVFFNRHMNERVHFGAWDNLEKTAKANGIEGLDERIGQAVKNYQIAFSLEPKAKTSLISKSMEYCVEEGRKYLEICLRYKKK